MRLAERLHTQALERARRAAAAEDTPVAERVRGVLAAKLELVLRLAGDSPHSAELLDAKARLFGDICHTFTADLRRRLLTGLFTQAGTPAAVEPAEAADICIALVVGLESVSDARQLFTPASDALLAGLLAGPMSECTSRVTTPGGAPSGSATHPA